MDDISVEAEQVAIRIAGEQVRARAEQRITAQRADHAVDLQADAVRQRHGIRPRQQAETFILKSASEHGDLAVRAGDRRACRIPVAVGHDRRGGEGDSDCDAGNACQKKARITIGRHGNLTLQQALVRRL